MHCIISTVVVAFEINYLILSYLIYNTHFHIAEACTWDLRLALLYKVVMGHVGIQPDHVGLVAADDRTRAKHQFKFRAVGSSTQAFRRSFAV